MSEIFINRYISRENRKSQETFKCMNCGFEINADLNAALNILNRFSEDVFREKLLNLNSMGLYEPKKLNKDKIRQIIEDMYDIITLKFGQIAVN